MPTKEKTFFGRLGAMGFRREARPALQGPDAMHLDSFDESWYLQRYPDVSDAVEIGQVPSAREHYIRYGYAEGRLGSAAMEVQSAAPEDDSADLQEIAPSNLLSLHVTPVVEWAVVANDVFVISGVCGASVTEPPEVYCEETRLSLKAFASHRRSDLSRGAQGFIAIVDVVDGRTPDAVYFSANPENCFSKPDLSLGDFKTFCRHAASEVLLDLAILLNDVTLSSECMETIASNLRSRIRSIPSFQETTTLAASLDSAWMTNKDAPCLFATGWILETRTSTKANCYCFALTDKLSTMTLFKGMMSRPDLEGFKVRYEVPGWPGFVATGSRLKSKPAAEAYILCLCKDADGGIAAVAKQFSPTKEGAFFDHAVDAISKSPKSSASRNRLLNALGLLFPAPLREIAVHDQEARTRTKSGETPACHLLLDLRSENAELQNVIEEIVQDKFDRVVITALEDRGDGQAQHALQSLVSRNPALDLTIKFITDEKQFLMRRGTFGVGDVVVIGRPYDILQFDVSDQAIDRFLLDRRSHVRKSYGYVHDGLSETVATRAAESFGVLEALGSRFFDPAAGFAAVMPASHFRQLSLADPPLGCAVNEVKAFLLVSEKLGAAAIKIGSERLFYPTGLAGGRHKLDSVTIAKLDFARVQARLSQAALGV